LVGFLLRRIVFAAVVVLAAASAAFLLIHLAPGDAVEEFGPGVDPAQVRAGRAARGLDRPIAAQYASWMAGALRLDFGTSRKYGRPVRALVGERARNTAALGGVSLALATAIGIPLGVLTGSRRRGLLPGVVRAISLFLLAVPPLVAALALSALAARAGWLAPGGASAHNLVVPALALALPLAAVLERLQSQAIRDTLGERYLRAAVGRGIPPRLVIWKHALRNALAPIAGLYGVIAGSLLSGSFIVEIITDWPGLGLLMIDGLRARDLYLVAGCAAAGAAVLAAAILVSDLLHAAIDPRLRERA
jgi:peptide/nickel transport system permease protein